MGLLSQYILTNLIDSSDPEPAHDMSDSQTQNIDGWPDPPILLEEFVIKTVHSNILSCQIILLQRLNELSFKLEKLYS